MVRQLFFGARFEGFEFVSVLSLQLIDLLGQHCLGLECVLLDACDQLLLLVNDFLQLVYPFIILSVALLLVSALVIPGVD